MLTREKTILMQAKRGSAAVVVYLRSLHEEQPQITTLAGCPSTNFDWRPGP
jgi:hypothetical protein